MSANSYSANLGRTKIINKRVDIKLHIKKKGKEKKYTKKEKPPTQTQAQDFCYQKKKK